MGVMGKVWAWLGIEGEEVVREEMLPLSGNTEESGRSTPNVVSIHSNKTMKVVVCEPDSYEEVQVLADHIKARRQVIINFENTPPDAARRIIDFVSGTTYALEGSCQQLGKTIFVFAPSNVEIAKDHRAMARRPGWSSSPGGER